MRDITFYTPGHRAPWYPEAIRPVMACWGFLLPFWVSGFGLRVCYPTRVCGLVFRVSGFGLSILNLELQAPTWATLYGNWRVYRWCFRKLGFLFLVQPFLVGIRLNVGVFFAPGLLPHSNNPYLGREVKYTV